MSEAVSALHGLCFWLASIRHEITLELAQMLKGHGAAGAVFVLVTFGQIIPAP